MKNTFYRPELKNSATIKMHEIVNKLKSDFYEMDNTSEDEIIEYIKKLIDQGKPLKNNREIFLKLKKEAEN